MNKIKIFSSEYLTLPYDPDWMNEEMKQGFRLCKVEETERNWISWEKPVPDQVRSKHIWPQTPVLLLLWVIHAVLKNGTLPCPALLEYVYFNTVQWLMYKHKDNNTTWTWPYSQRDHSFVQWFNYSGCCQWTKWLNSRNVCRVKVMFCWSPLCCNCTSVLQRHQATHVPCYKVMAHVAVITMLQHSWV